MISDPNLRRRWQYSICRCMAHFHYPTCRALLSGCHSAALVESNEGPANMLLSIHGEELEVRSKSTDPLFPLLKKAVSLDRQFHFFNDVVGCDQIHPVGFRLAANRCLFLAGIGIGIDQEVWKPAIGAASPGI